MKTVVAILFTSISSLLFFGCSLKSEEESVKEVVNHFLTEVNDPTKTLTPDLVTENFNKMFYGGKSFYTAKDWILTAKKENDSVLSVESKSSTFNSFGKPIENIQSFALTKKYGKWQIFDSYNLIAFELDFTIVDTQWEFYWDRAKDEILSDLQKNLKLKILTKGHGNIYNDSRQGKLRLINDSDYDIKGVDILIEHFDRNNVSVNTDHQGVYDIIRKHGYRDFEWYTSDCNNCFRQEFKINFIREHH